MERRELEALSTSQLQRLISDAVDVLAGRAGKTCSTETTFQPPARSPASSGSIFQFGVDSSSSSTGGSLFGTGGSLFHYNAMSSSLFASTNTIGAIPSASTVQTGTEASRNEQEAEEQEPDAEEEVTVVPGWTPSITLEVKDSFETGEEEEEEVYSQRSKLYRWRDEWKERGVGEAKLLRDRKGRVRFLMRQEKTGKVVANHLLTTHHPYCNLEPNAGNEKIWVWMAQDYSEEEMQEEKIALKFGSVELATAFKVAFDRERDKLHSKDNEEKKT
mmetsp:Transcript_39253/g.62158  ORF Transcript_39253/g.62158 Transcript_39253/m.62158 type:complete len:274 (+) Transcript_39253:44-865(+)